MVLGARNAKANSMQRKILCSLVLETVFLSLLALERAGLSVHAGYGRMLTLVALSLFPTRT